MENNAASVTRSQQWLEHHVTAWKDLFPPETTTWLSPEQETSIELAQKLLASARVTRAEWYLCQALTKPDSSKCLDRLLGHTSDLASDSQCAWETLVEPILAARVKELSGAKEAKTDSKKDEQKEKKDKKEKKDDKDKPEKKDKKEKDKNTDKPKKKEKEDKGKNNKPEKKDKDGKGNKDKAF